MMAVARHLAVMWTVVAAVGLAALGAAWACAPQAAIGVAPAS